MVSISQRARQVQPFRVMDVISRVAELERQGRHVCHLEVGEPDFTTADAVVEAGRQALAAGHTAYTEAAGLAGLRHRIACWYGERYGLDLNPRRVFVTPGASGALYLAAQLLHDPGSEVLLPDPGYPCNRNFLTLAGAVPRPVALSPEEGWSLSVDRLEASYHPGVSSLWLASPANPTGAVSDRAELESIVQWARDRGVSLVSDEIYHGLEFGDRLPTVLEMEPDALVVNSFSKYFGMTGWRAGWLIVPEALVEVTNRLAQNLFISAPTVSQYAALRALDTDVRHVLEERRRAFLERRDYLAAELPRLGFHLPSAGYGAFYLYAGIQRWKEHSESFCRRILDEHGVALTPGTDFSLHTGADHVRLAFTTGMEELQEAVRRLEQAL